MRIRALALAAVAAAVPLTALAQPAELERARSERTAALAEASRLGREAEAIATRYRRAQADAAALTARLIDALREELAADARLAEARTAFSRRVSAVYRAGPSSFVAALLGSESPRDVLSAGEFFERAVERDIAASAEALEQAAVSVEDRDALERRKEELAERQRALAELHTLAELRLGKAQAAARTAGVRVAALEAAREALMAGDAIGAGAIDALDGADQSDLLALLGPTGGRGCEIPAGLRSTGAVFEGTASHYGEGDGFAGEPTATGAIFDPSLFTAAHKTLPLNSFIHVTFKGRCATLLVNDRGPFHLDWILDLSSGAAYYLGYGSAGTAHVRAEILTRAG